MTKYRIFPYFFEQNQDLLASYVSFFAKYSELVVFDLITGMMILKSFSERREVTYETQTDAGSGRSD